MQLILSSLASYSALVQLNVNPEVTCKRHKGKEKKFECLVVLVVASRSSLGSEVDFV